MEETIKRIKKELIEDQYVDFWWGKDILILLDYIENESIPKEKVKEIIYPTPKNEVPIEVQTSEMYSKLQELLGDD